jgi:hypothetical protein
MSELRVGGFSWYIIMFVYFVAARIDRLLIMWPVVRCLSDSVSPLRIFIFLISFSYSPLDPVLKSHITTTTSCTSIFIVSILWEIQLLPQHYVI